MLRVVSVVFLALAIFAILGAVLFVVDFSGISSGLGERSAPGFTVATWKTVAIAVLLLPAAAWFGVEGLRVSGRAPAQVQGDRGNLVVGQ